MSDRFEDHRGVIQDLYEGDDEAVTRITTVSGAVRGNHFHKHTTQWMIVLTGKLLVASGGTQYFIGEGQMCKHAPGVAHAWRAWDGDAECIVVTKGPRSGENYESDTFRLTEPLLP